MFLALPIRLLREVDRFLGAEPEVDQATEVARHCLLLHDEMALDGGRDDL